MKRALFAAAALLAAACQQEGGNASAPEGNGATARTSPVARGERPKTNILQALAGSADHKTLANAVRAAGLTQTLSGAQPYTLFAPTEAAFQKLPGGAGGLLAPEAKGQLVALLTGHIVPGMVTAADLGRAIDRGKGKAQLATVGGSNLSFSRDGDSILVTDAAGGQARIIQADMLQSNGVVHSVDGVLKGR
ncbi:MAG: hypothetical protein QOG72_2866 [Sphingomonadales bacterium]|jgi:uncharacterized surface protein with fasciclin (FAS1) repeats|nr:hypothetical protein [Sphingomonadales bacterium]